MTELTTKLLKEAMDRLYKEVTDHNSQGKAKWKKTKEGYKYSRKHLVFIKNGSTFSELKFTIKVMSNFCEIFGFKNFWQLKHYNPKLAVAALKIIEDYDN